MLPEATDVRKIQPRGEQIGSTGYFRPTTATDAALTTGRETGRCTTRANTQALEIIELIRCHRPHLFGAYLSQNGPSGRIPTRLRELPSRTDNAAPPAKRPRLAFSPSAEQERMHQLLTSTQHAGKSSDVFIEFVLGMDQFAWHPGTLASVYDLLVWIPWPVNLSIQTLGSVRPV